MSDEFVPQAPKKKKAEAGGCEAWVTSFGDLMSLLLTFFILIVSFSNTELIKFRQAMGALQGSTGALTDAPGSSIMPKRIPKPDMNEQVVTHNSMDEFLDELENSYMEEAQSDLISVEKVKDGLIIRLGNTLLFEPGQATLNPRALSLLSRIGKIIVLYDYYAVIEGHSDNTPISTPQYPSNWELSATRAINILRFLVDEVGVNPRTILAIGRGQYQPIAPNDTPENRAKNRRVEIYLNYMYLSGKELLESRNFQ